MLLGRHRHQRLIHSPHHLHIKYLHTKHQYTKHLHHNPNLRHNPNLHPNHQCACQRQVDQVMLR